MGGEESHHSYEGAVWSSRRHGGKRVIHGYHGMDRHSEALGSFMRNQHRAEQTKLSSESE